MVCFLSTFQRFKTSDMKKTNKFLLGVAAAAAIGLIFYTLRNRRQLELRHARVADEGYETAHDVLYPNQKGRGRKLHFGPVLPE
jgi:hypothetical protein